MTLWGITQTLIPPLPMSNLVTYPENTHPRPPVKGGFGYTSQERRRRWRALKRAGFALLEKFRVASTLNPSAPWFIPGKSEERRSRKEKKVKAPKKRAKPLLSFGDDDDAMEGASLLDRIVVERTDVKVKRAVVKHRKQSDQGSSKDRYQLCETHVAADGGDFVVCSRCGKVLRKKSS